MIETKYAMQLLEDWKRNHDQIEKLCDSVHAIFGHMPETKFYETVWESFGYHTLALSAALGDESDWLNWYQFDNEMGKNPHDASPPGGKMRKVKTLAQLLKIIEESR